MVLSAIPKDYKIIKDDQEQIGHSEWKGHWAFMIPWFYYSWLHGLSSWNTTVLRQATEIYDLTALWPAGMPRALLLTCTWSSSGCVLTWPFFWVQEKVSSLLSPGVSSLLRSLVWMSLNCPDLGTDEGVGTILLTLHLDSTQIKQGSWRLFIYFLCRNTMINYPKFHCQTLSLLPVVKASALWLMLCFGCWVPSKGPRIERCAFLGWWCWENLGTMVGLSGSSLGHGLEDSCGILVSSWLKTQCVALSHTVTMIGHLFRAPWTLSRTWSCSIVTYINLFLLDKYIVSGILP